MEDDDSQQFCLRWHNHQSTVLGALGRLLGSGLLSDVTLSAEGKTMRAHKLVLAACSEYFADLFKETEGQGATLVVLVGCEMQSLRLLLHFMYTGEVTAPRNALPTLLQLAADMRVPGLADANANMPPKSNYFCDKMDLENSNNVMKQFLQPTLTKCTESKGVNYDSFYNNNNNNNDESERNILETVKIEDDVSAGAEINNSNSGLNCMKTLFGLQDHVGTLSDNTFLSRRECVNDKYRKLDRIVESLYSSHKIPQSPTTNLYGKHDLDSPTEPDFTAPAMPKDTHDRPPILPYNDRKWRGNQNGGAICTICSKRLSNQYNLRVHMETHAGARHACNSCGHVSRSRDALRKHVAYRHPAVPRNIT